MTASRSLCSRVVGVAADPVAEILEPRRMLAEIAGDRQRPSPIARRW